MLTHGPIFIGRGGWTGLPGKPHLFFKLKLLQLAQRDAELVGLSTKFCPIGRDARGLFFFRFLNLIILHNVSSYALGPRSRASAEATCCIQTPLPDNEP